MNVKLSVIEQSFVIQTLKLYVELENVAFQGLFTSQILDLIIRQDLCSQSFNIVAIRDGLRPIKLGGGGGGAIT